MRVAALVLASLFYTALARADSGPILLHSPAELERVMGDGRVPAYPGPECHHGDPEHPEFGTLIYRQKYLYAGEEYYVGWDCPELVEICNRHPDWRMCR